MYYGIMRATATMYGYNDKLNVITHGHNTPDEVQREMDDKIKHLPRRIYLETYPFDTAIAKIQGEPIMIPEGYFGVVVILDGRKQEDMIS